MAADANLVEMKTGWISLGPIRIRSRSFTGMLLRSLSRNKLVMISTFVILMTILVAIVAPYITPYPPNEGSLLERLNPPSSEHWFGTDSTGRDVFSRVIMGTRYALQIGFIALFMGLVPGTILGLVAAYWGGYWDQLISGLTDIFLAFPYFLTAIVIVTILGPSLQNAILAVGLYNIPIYIRLVRSVALAVKNEDYVLSAHMVGASNFRIIRTHILPNVLTPMIIQASLSFPRSILSASSLGFLGLGAQPPIPEWGTEVAINRQYFVVAPHAVFFPILAIAVFSIAFNFLGDGLRDALDPRTRHRD